MAAKISSELKNEVKALREVCGVFIDLRKATEESLLAYLAANAIVNEPEVKEEIEIESNEPEALSEIKEEIEIELNDYWTKWSVAYSRLRANLTPTFKEVPEALLINTKPKDTFVSPAIIGVAIALASVEMFNLAKLIFKWGQKQVKDSNFTFLDLSLTLDAIMANIGKKRAIQQWATIPQGWRKTAKAFLARRAQDAFNDCATFAQMARITNFIKGL